VKPSLVLLLIALPLLTSRVAFAECPKLPDDIRAIAKSSAVVFSGTVTQIASSGVSEIGREAVTLAVDRVWKGSPSRQIVVYNITNKTLTGITDVGFVFSKGTKYIVFAHRLTSEERAHFGLAASGPVAFGIAACGGGTHPYEDARPEVAKLGAGRAPSPK
jgi:hypothetical protein